MTIGGLLIISADDWGVDQPTTDAIRQCFDAGAVTSVSGMVFMAGSEAAAQLASEREVPAGLHINLTQPFNGSAVDGAVGRRQAQIAAHFAGPNWRRWGISPVWFAEIERAIAEQLAGFHDLYGREPSHFDGHEHIQQSIGVLAARTLPSGAKMRPSFTFLPGDKTFPNRSVRGVVNRVMRTRFRSPRYFFSLRDMHPALGGVALEEKLALSGGSTVEVMTHPARDDEREILLDPSWIQLVAQRNLGTYDDLQPRRPGAWHSRGSSR